MGKGKGKKKGYIRPKNLLIPMFHYMHCQQYDGDIPIFDIEHQKGNDYFWFEFSIKPTYVSQTYRILFIKFDGYNPYIYLVYPMFPEKGSEKYPVPHNYEHEAQKLCLTFPEYKEWKKRTLPETYIPWTALWLYYYEEWLYSNEWKGSGLEPNDPEVLEMRESEKFQIKEKFKPDKSPLNRGRKICFRRRELYIKKLKMENK